MSTLVEVLYPAPDARRTPLSLLVWWESRRPLYNRVVGLTGLFSLGVVELVSALAPGLPGPDPRTALAIAVAYGVLANVCYSLGWLTELAARGVWGARAPRMGPLLFREGLIFSVGLTLFPLLLTALLLLASAVLAVLGERLP